MWRVNWRKKGAHSYNTYEVSCTDKKDWVCLASNLWRSAWHSPEVDALAVWASSSLFISVHATKSLTSFARVKQPNSLLSRELWFLFSWAEPPEADEDPDCLDHCKYGDSNTLKRHHGVSGSNRFPRFTTLSDFDWFSDTITCSRHVVLKYL